MLSIQSTFRKQIEDHAEQGYPHEVVGILAGNSQLNSVQVIQPLTNEWGETHNRYKVGPLALYRATQALEQEGWDVLGYYHSHPDHTSEYSEYDKEHALPNLSYVIVSVLDGHSNTIQSWRLSDDRSCMIEEQLDFI